jgi:DNA-binding NtrC family response regulator
METTVLVIEKNTLMRRCLTWKMQREGWRVFAANDRSEALQAVRGNDIDVVLLGLTGFEYEALQILKTIKNVSPLTEIILLTGSGQISLAIQGMKLGAFDDILVPFNLESLLSQVQKAREHKRRKQRPRKSLLRRFQEMIATPISAKANDQDSVREPRRFAENDEHGSGDTKKS